MDIHSMLPFLSAPELLLLGRRILASPAQEYENVTLTAVLPFMEEKDVDALMLEYAAKNAPLAPFYPFSSSAGLSQLTDLFVGGTLLQNPKSLLPFLEDEDVAKIAKKVAENQGVYQGLTLETLLPFLADDMIDVLFLKACQSQDPKVKTYAAFASDNALHQVVQDYQDGKVTEAVINSLYPFFDDEDIKAIFKKAIDAKA
jgi:hypothetical protein